MQLSEKYRIVEDDNNVILQFFETRVKEKKNGTKEEYEFTENYYYPTLKSALISFVQKELKYAESIDEVLSRIIEIEDRISNSLATVKK